MQDVLIIQSGICFRRFSHIFAASECGRIIDLRTMAPAKITGNSNGYVKVGRRPHGDLVHRVVATCWLKRPEGATHVHHINGDKADNRAANLEWVSPRQHFTERHDLSGNGRYARSEDTRQKLREYRTGRQTSEETKQKQREATSTQWALGLRTQKLKGRKATAEHRANISRSSIRKVRCMVDGIVYASFTEAGRALGMRPLSLRKRCLSANFPSYSVLVE